MCPRSDSPAGVMWRQLIALQDLHWPFKAVISVHLHPVKRIHGAYSSGHRKQKDSNESSERASTEEKRKCWTMSCSSQTVSSVFTMAHDHTPRFSQLPDTDFGADSTTWTNNSPSPQMPRQQRRQRAALTKAVGEISEFYADGGALDSQTTDTQYFGCLLAGSEDTHTAERVLPTINLDQPSL
ncbi:hypothetical protein A0H81_11944 [Grifola frondosa]|uniref:Uncharacterized protein n=1 Tax=Grifola frondosa TaxID=5627 RepID=A0A1C7LVN9_GRIFR|nr:hypothetical protein A0H81_11944 [Grifola frondosa]